MSYKKFSPEIKKVISLSRDIAKKYQSEVVDLGHIFLAILKHEEKNAITALNGLNINLTKLAEEVTKFVATPVEVTEEKTKSHLNVSQLPLSLEAEKVLKITFLEARKLNAEEVQVAHLILAILLYNVSNILNILKQQKLTYKKYLEAYSNIVQPQVDLDDILKMMENEIEHGKPLKEDVLKVINAIKLKYEKRFNVTFSEEAIKLCANLSEKYIPDKEFSAKPFDMFIKVSAFTQNTYTVFPKHIKELQAHLEHFKTLKNEAVKNQAYEKAADLRDDEQRLRNTLELAKKEWNRGKIIEKIPVQLDDIYQVFHKKTGLSIEDLKSRKDI